MRCTVPYCLPLQATTCKGTLNAAKVQYKLRVAIGLSLFWYGSMEWNMEKNLVWNRTWNERFLVWNRNGMKETCLYGKWKKSPSFHTHALHTV